MPIVSVRIPQIGEGLQEARLVAVLKQPGDHVRRDEPIYQMETDKAVMDVESPYEGILQEWLAAVDTILPIGGEIARMEVGEGVKEMSAGHGPAARAESAPAASGSGDKVVSVLIPQIGEGLQEARLVAVLKQPGDAIRRDEPIYQMETDKAVMDVESPYSGVLVAWSAPVDTVLAIGAEVATMRVSEGVVQQAAGHGPVVPVASAATPVSTANVAEASAVRRTDIPPRTRAHAKSKGVSETQLQSIPAAGSKLMPEDVDRWLSQGREGASRPAERVVAAAGNYSEAPMDSKQRLLSSRLVRGSQLVVPGTISVSTNWEGLDALRGQYKSAGGDFQPSTFTMFAFCVARALKDFPAFRTTLVGDSTLRTYNTAHLGIAVARPGDELVQARIDDADRLEWVDFANSVRAQIELARNGQDQANETLTLSLTNMQSFGLRDAVPVVVPPAVGTLFLGEVFRAIDQNSDELKLIKTVNLALTFDHRLINGVGASEFLNAIKANVEGGSDLIPAP